MGLGGLLARLTAIVLVLAILAGCAGFLLPRERTIESKAVILAPPERVFDFVTDAKGFAKWRDDVANVVVDEGSNPPSWSETSLGWQLKFREVKRERPSRYEVEFESPSGFQGRRIYVFEATESGDRTKIIRTDVFEIGNPLRRVYSYLAINLQSVINAQSEDLGREFLSEPLNGEPSESAPAGSAPVGSAPVGSAPTSGGSPSPSSTSAMPPANTPAATGPAATAPAGTAPAGTIPAATGTRPLGSGAATPLPTGPAPNGPFVPGMLPAATPSASPSPTPARI